MIHDSQSVRIWWRRTCRWHTRPLCSISLLLRLCRTSPACKKSCSGPETADLQRERVQLRQTLVPQCETNSTNQNVSLWDQIFLQPGTVKPNLFLEEQSIWAFQSRVSPSSERPGCRGGRTEDWSSADVRSGSPTEEPSVRTAGLDVGTRMLAAQIPEQERNTRCNNELTTEGFTAAARQLKQQNLSLKRLII